jgi:hypothetical protein
MKKLLSSIALLITLAAPNAYAAELVTNLMTTHVFESTFKDKETGERVKYNEENQMYSLWFDVELTEDERNRLDAGTQMKYGFGMFKDSFYNTGPIAGVVVEPRIKQYFVPVIGKFETYYGIGAIMTTTYESMSFMPILIAHVGVRTETWSANLGAYGMGAALTANLGYHF